jgi:SpoVK/Ycf46/Vps4 family AAA+-type ATPase
MNYNQDIQTLIEAVAKSPDNTTLRYYLAEKFMHSGFVPEAEVQLQEILKLDRSNMAAKELLAEAFYKGKKFSAIVMIAEDIQDTNEMPFKLKVWYTKALVKEKNLRLAQEMYEEILDDSPRFSDPELDEALRIKAFSDLEELDLDKELFLEESNISFKDVGGLADVKKEINLKIIKPLLNPDLYKMYGKKVGGGILLYGPPGCGKTYMARATAGEIDAKFINVGINDILDMYIGQSERNLADVFEVAREHTPCVLFFDEVDAIGASRHQMINQAGKNVINQFLSEMDGISSDNEGLLIVGATNTPWALDTAFRRPGRFDRIIFVPPPDNDARAAIFELALREKPLGEGINYAKLAKSTDMFSGADIYSVVDRAIEAKLEIALETGEVQPIEMTDLQQAIKKTKPSTMEWFNTAKNYALYANQSGLYDEILKYIK